MELELESLERAIAVFHEARTETAAFDDVSAVKVGDWVNPHVHLELGLHSEITPPFMEAFLETQNALYRLIAYIKYDSADIRRLTQADLEEYQIRVKVLDGSSELFGEFASSLGKMAEAAVSKMTGKQIAVLLAGLTIIISGEHGFTTYLEHRKDVRAEEAQSDERKQYIAALRYADGREADTTKEVIETFRAEGGIPSRAVDASASTHAALLRAASQTRESTIGNVHLAQAEARDLRGSARRPVTKMIVEREMRVVDINTSDPAHTSVVVEEAETGAQHRLAFADRLIQDRDAGKLFDSLRGRTTVWLRLDVKDVGGELRVVDILGVVAPPTDVDAVRVANNE